MMIATIGSALRSSRHSAPLSWIALVLLVSGCFRGTPGDPVEKDSHELMVDMLRESRELARYQDPFLASEQVVLRQQELRVTGPSLSKTDRFDLLLTVAELELREGQNGPAIEHLLAALELAKQSEPDDVGAVTLRLAIAYLRLGETENCVHCRTGESCILPIRAAGIHEQTTGSEKSIEYSMAVLAENPNNATARWLLNIAAMTLGRYPQDVPEQHRIPPERFSDAADFPRFINVAPVLGLDTMSLLGGAIADDFDNDGLIDVFVSGWHLRDQLRLFRNRGDGTFEERIEAAGLKGITGGGNLIQADYDNDGDLDVLVLRGAWRTSIGMYVNSLLQNDGTGRFRDVTFDAGLGEPAFPSQTAAWGDIDLDGDLDLYVGNEHFPCQLFVNDGKGVFVDQANEAGVANNRWAKGVVFGDFDGDRYPDLYVSNYGEPNRLYRNNGAGRFTDEAVALDMTEPEYSFPVWFWDFNNDGALDLYAPSYDFDIAHVAAQYFNEDVTAERDRLYQGDGTGQFRDVGEAVGLDVVTQPMGANFGDLDNDGFLDFYLGTGYPEYEALMPNVMYRNVGGKRFADVTVAGGFGHLQKGHGVAFADFDNDGDQDVFIELGGAYKGDAFGNALFENPGFDKHWIRIKLMGRDSNRCAIGARIRIDITADGTDRSIFRWVNSGGSFGANPLTQQIGIGSATSMESVEIFWPKTGQTQTFHDVAADQFIEIDEAAQAYRRRELPQFSLTKAPKR